MKITIEKISIEVADNDISQLFKHFLSKCKCQHVDIHEPSNKDSEVLATMQLEEIDEMEHELEEKVDVLEHDVDRQIQIMKENQEQRTTLVPPKEETTSSSNHATTTATTYARPPALRDENGKYLGKPYKCEMCGKEFLSAHKDAKFCSRACSARWRINVMGQQMPRSTGRPMAKEQRELRCKLCNAKIITDNPNKGPFCNTSHATLFSRFDKAHERTGVTIQEYCEAYNIPYHNEGEET